MAETPPTTNNFGTVWANPPPCLIFIGLAIVVLIFFAPILPTFFLADDYNYVGHLLVHARQYVQGEQLGKWFIDFSAQGLQNPELSVFFRPVVQWLWLTDYVAWGTDAFGYHLTNIILHALNSFLVFLLASRVIHNRWGGIAAGLLFALHPIHADSVAWIPDRTDVLSALFYFASATFFVLYRQRARQFYGTLAVIAFALAIGTKENTVALPLVLLTYDLLFSFRARQWKILVAQIPYWLVLGAYVAARFFFLGEFGRNTGGGLMSYGVELFFEFYTMALAAPFIADMNLPLLITTLGMAIVTLVIYRTRAAVWFGAAWIAFSLLPAISAAHVAPRLAYTPSAGLALGLGAIIAQPFARQTLKTRMVGTALFAFFVLVYAWGLAARVDNWAAAGSLADSVRSESLRLHPTLPPGARLYYVGVPDILRGIHIYNNNFDMAIRIVYKNPNLDVARVDKFPIITERLDRTYFLEFQRRKITERDDLSQAMQARARCGGKPAIVWDFARGDAGWETWNQIASLAVHNGVWQLQAQGDDPNLGSPLFDLSAFALGDIEIEMRVCGEQPTTRGAIYWQVNGQGDFVPAQQQTFTINADGAFHTYRVNLAATNRLLIGDRITRLRLDPSEMPAEIELRAIRVERVCMQEGVSCECPP